MARSHRRGRRLLSLLPLLALAAQQAPSENCSNVEEHQRPYGAVIPITPIATGAPILVENRAVIAHEAVQIAEASWQLTAELRLTELGTYVFPAGTPVESDYVRDAWRQCLPHGPAPTHPAPLRPGQRPGIGMLPCLADRDGDGAYEAVDLFTTDYRVHVPMERRDATVVLPAPLRLAPHPQGHSRRQHAHRRIWVDQRPGYAPRLAVNYAVHDGETATPGRFVTGVDGAHVFEPSPITRPPAHADNDSGYFGGTNENAPFDPVAGEVIEFAGLRLRVGQDGSHWTLQPLADRFPTWIRFGCDGRRPIFGLQG